jgi:hypothetical protein
MRFISASKTISSHSVEHLRSILKQRATAVQHPDTIDHVDRYEIRMRVHIKGRGMGFYSEVATAVELEETATRARLVARSSATWPLILSTGMASVVAFFRSSHTAAAW